jgi:hypothetical protein
MALFGSASFPHKMIIVDLRRKVVQLPQWRLDAGFERGHPFHYFSTQINNVACQRTRSRDGAFKEEVDRRETEMTAMTIAIMLVSALHQYFGYPITRPQIG